MDKKHLIEKPQMFFKIALLDSSSFKLILYEQCLRKNSIVCLKTGSGKTFIAIMLIKQLAEAVRKPYNEGGKRTVFVVNNVLLVSQQAKYIRKMTGLIVGEYHGEKCINNKIIDHWDIEIWNKIFETTQVLVMTGGIFQDILYHGFICMLNIPMAAIITNENYSLLSV